MPLGVFFLENLQLWKLLHKYNMKLKYATLGKPKGTPGRGRKSNPDRWICGPDLLTREKYYAWLKHRAQATYRGEDYSLTWDDWQSLWPNDLWNNRGRSSSSFCLTRLDFEQGWHQHNVCVMTRKQHFDIVKQHNARI